MRSKSNHQPVRFIATLFFIRDFSNFKSNEMGIPLYCSPVPSSKQPIRGLPTARVLNEIVRHVYCSIPTAQHETKSDPSPL